MILRDYQQDASNAILRSFELGNKGTMAVLPCRSGKTVIFSDVINKAKGPIVAIAHRSVLIGQMSRTLGKFGIRHRFICADETRRNIIKSHYKEFGKSYFDPTSEVVVSSVNTLKSRMSSLKEWAAQVKLAVTDEGHHIVRDNMWGEVLEELFPNANYLAVTATPIRGDGKGLGVSSDGLMDNIVLGPDMRFLTKKGHIAEYKIYVPPNNLDLSKVTTSRITGEYGKKGLRTAVERSTITGDAVEHYRRFADGLPGITFCIDVNMAKQVAEDYNAAGIPARVMTGESSDAERTEIIEGLQSRSLLQIVAVDIVSEGFDLDGLYVVTMLRPTASLGLYIQQFCRCLNPADDKPHGIIIDAVGNVRKHGLPDARREWTLEPRDKRGGGSSEGIIQIRTCAECAFAWEGMDRKCPLCGHETPPQRRDGPEWVEGDLEELDAATLARMRGEVIDVEAPFQPSAYVPNSIILGKHRNDHIANQGCQKALRESMAQYAGERRAQGYSNSDIYRHYWYDFGIDMVSSQALNKKEAMELKGKIDAHPLCNIQR